MDAKGAVEYGIVDEVLDSPPEKKAELSEAEEAKETDETE